ncbi:branched-chain amino acid aminotransferase [Bacillus sp. Cr_A10]|uniref:branched-chain amino acid aminotransferase n=1 Tax=Bacillus sp. Cr_A10 TaxID=3033993 RepID=UPI0023DAFC08|nr:branched-chain amino acid aminotransferase [Bacillus sp. Cr_A10]MDF2067093.1 branched-chain amino acid aminotransferase [Bacillus sp. Cr_A10]
MITEKLSKKINEANGVEINLLIEEKDYAERHQLLSAEQKVVITEKNEQFSEAIIERFVKETDETVSKGTKEFFQSPLSHVKENQTEYVYVESKSFDIINVDAIALEFDEVFEVYTAMFGLALQKKFGGSIRDYLNQHFDSEKMNYSLMFSGEDGLWEVNLPLNYMAGFNEDTTIEQTYQFLYSFIFSLVEAVENNK